MLFPVGMVFSGAVAAQLKTYCNSFGRCQCFIFCHLPLLLCHLLLILRSAAGKGLTTIALVYANTSRAVFLTTFLLLSVQF